MRLTDAVTLVTGSSRGIGAAIARELAARGSCVVLHGRDAQRLAEAARRLDAVPLTVDLSTADGPRVLADLATAAYGRVDAVVHCAGIGYFGSTAGMAPGDIDRILDLNLRAPVQLTRLLLPGMAAAGRGHMSFIASIAGLTGVANESVYSASKAALVTFADALRLELAGTGIGVSVVSPGAVRTGFAARRGVPYDRKVPRPIDAAHVAGVVVRGIERDRPRAVVPAWLSIAPAIRSAMPPVYRMLARHFG